MLSAVFMEMTVQQRYRLFCEHAGEDAELSAALAALAEDPAGREDAFFRELAFGTGGLRGILGAGTNRMNRYTVRRASAGLSDYTDGLPAGRGGAIAISYDSRLGSRMFAEEAATVFAAAGHPVYLMPTLMPTPCLSYAVRSLGCVAGVMVTASHNPAPYNGYKVYGADGCQITDAAAKKIVAAIGRHAYFEPLGTTFAAALAAGRIRYIAEEFLTSFLSEVKKTSPLTEDAPADRSLRIVYTPLNGTGLVPVTRILRENGYENLSVVSAQRDPDGHFPTCPYPNPEMPEALALALQQAEAEGADLVLATDPDCDRVGIAVRERQGTYTLLTGNEVGLLLLDFIASERAKQGTLPPSPVLVRTVVTTDLADRIAAHYGIAVTEVLTGFKYIGEVIGRLEAEGRAGDFLFGFEESYGYLGGSYVRDKDGVYGAFIIAEMCAAARAAGLTLTERLAELYRTYGYAKNSLRAYTLTGAAGLEKMRMVMAHFRTGVKSIGPSRVQDVTDYLSPDTGLPPSDVLKFRLADASTVVIRPSGTEPKLKVYISVRADGEEKAAEKESALAESISSVIRQICGE